MQNDKANKMGIGSAIKDTREKRNIRQGEFAKLIGVSQTYLSQIENGKKAPSLELIRTAAETLGFPVFFLFLKGLDLDGVPEHKRQLYRALRPPLIAALESFFLN